MARIEATEPSQLASEPREGFVFLSYKREEVEYADRLLQLFLQHGHNVWWDRDIQCGQVWDEALDQAVKESHCIVVLWSKLSTQSRWVTHEASSAIARGVYAPVCIDHCAIEPPFDRLQATDLIEWEGNPDHPGVSQLLNHVNQLVPRRQSLARRVRRKLWVQRTAVASVLFALAALGILLWQTFASRSQLDQLDNIVTTQERQFHPVLLATSKLDQRYQRFRAYFLDWQAILEDELDSTPGFSASNAEVNNADVLRHIPRRFLSSLLAAVDSVNALITLAEVDGEVAIFRGLLAHARDSDDRVFSKRRLMNMAGEEFASQYFAPGNVEESLARARATLEGLLALYGSLASPAVGDRCFSFAGVGGVRESQFGILSHDLAELRELPLKLSDENVAVQPDMVDLFNIAFPVDGFEPDECL